MLLGVLAALGVLTSEAPHAIAVPSALLASCHGVLLARRELAKPAAWLIVPSGPAPPTIDGIAMRDLRLHWRGPLACLAWRDPGGRVQRLLGWPDVLDADARRELRLACEARRDVGPADSMAP